MRELRVAREPLALGEVLTPEQVGPPLRGFVALPPLVVAELPLALKKLACDRWKYSLISPPKSLVAAVTHCEVSPDGDDAWVRCLVLRPGAELVNEGAVIAAQAVEWLNLPRNVAACDAAPLPKGDLALEVSVELVPGWLEVSGAQLDCGDEQSASPCGRAKVFGIGLVPLHVELGVAHHLENHFEVCRSVLAESTNVLHNQHARIQI